MKIPQVYWAGDLFDHKDLIGNLLLARAFDRAAEGRWRAALPQTGEANAKRGDDIRNLDLKMLFQCAAVVAHFDGTDLDSGTVVEFCFAKFLDLPTVLLRTDFRDVNDRSTCPDPWNLMCSNYPRTRTLLIPALAEFHRCSGTDDPVEAFCASAAARIVGALDAASAEPPVIAPAEKLRQYELAVRCAGGGLEKILPPALLREIVGV